MSRYLRSLVRLAVLGLPLWGCGPKGSPPPSDGFQSHTNTAHAGSVQGRALTSEGQPIAGAVVFLTSEPGQPASKTATTDADGRFSFQTTELGHGWLVLNDRRGQGAVNQVTFYGDGVNNVGDLVAGPLENATQILGMRGVDYEERFSQSSGDYSFQVFSSDGSQAVAAHRLAGDANYDLVLLDTATGQETTLVAGVDLDTNYTQPLQFLGDRVLLYGTIRQGAQDSYWTTVAFDLTAGREVYAIPEDHRAAGFQVAQGALFALESVDRQHVDDTVFGAVYTYSYRPMKLDLATGAKSYGAQFDFGYISTFNTLLMDGQRWVVSPQHYCFGPNCMPGTYDATPVYEVSLLDLQPRYAGTVLGTGELGFSVLSPDGASIYGTLTHQPDLSGRTTSTDRRVGVVRFDLASGAATDLVSDVPYVSTSSSTYNSHSYYGLALSPDGSELAVLKATSDNSGDAPTVEALRLGSAGGAPAEVNLSAGGYTFCAGTYPSCQISFPKAGTLRLAELARQTPPAAMLLDLPQQGAPLLRAYPVGQTDDLPELLPSADGTQEWVRLRDAAGFFQLYQGPAGSQPSALSQATFLTAQHATPHFSPDGQSVLYFTRDPISGYVQLFRIQRATP